MNPNDEQTDWLTLLIEGKAPRWVPGSVAEYFLLAHQEGQSTPITPGLLKVDPVKQEVLWVAQTSVGELVPPEDLAACLGDLLTLAATHQHAMRHIFQQTALLWRAYREGRGFPHGSDLETELVSKLLALLQERFPTPWMRKIIRGHGRTPVTLLHQLIDLLFEALR